VAIKETGNMPLRFKFSVRDWIWFCLVFALILGWGSHVRYSWWLEDKVINHPTKVYVADVKLSEQLDELREELMVCKEKFAAVEYAATSIMNADQRKEFARLTGVKLSTGR
jgi:hypothetical protein